MNATSHLRRFVVYLCLTTLLVALIPGATSLPPTVLVIVLGFFLAIPVRTFLPHVEELTNYQQTLALAAFSPRPPPAL